MVGTEELLLIERIGIGAIVIYFLYLLVRILINRSFIQSDAMMDMAKGIIRDNIIAMGDVRDILKQMKEALVHHTETKDKLVEAFEDNTSAILNKMDNCKQAREKQFEKILKKP